MFALDWLTGLGFWSAYITIGGLFCVIFTKHCAPNSYAFIMGTLDKKIKGGRCYRAVDLVNLVDPVNMSLVVLFNFLLWPLPFTVIFLWGMLVLLTIGPYKLVFIFLRCLANNIPDINFKIIK